MCQRNLGASFRGVDADFEKVVKVWGAKARRSEAGGRGMRREAVESERKGSSAL